MASRLEAGDTAGWKPALQNVNCYGGTARKTRHICHCFYLNKTVSVGFPLKIAQRFNAGSQRKEKSTAPLGTTEPSLSYGAPTVTEGTVSHLDTISPAPQARGWAIFRIHER